MLVVNLYGGPGIAKSTLASDIFVTLKKDGINCENIPEYAKDFTWEQSYKTLANQVFIFAGQLHRLWRLQGQVDVAILDSPVLLTLPYDSSKSKNFRALVFEKYQEYDNLDYILNRVVPYQTAGRKETLEQAKEIDTAIKDVLDSFALNYTMIQPNDTAKVVSDVKNKLKLLRSNV